MGSNNSGSLDGASYPKVHNPSAYLMYVEAAPSWLNNPVHIVQHVNENRQSLLKSSVKAPKLSWHDMHHASYSFSHLSRDIEKWGIGDCYIIKMHKTYKAYRRAAKKQVYDRITNSIPQSYDRIERDQRNNKNFESLISLLLHASCKRITYIDVLIRVGNEQKSLGNKLSSQHTG